MTKREAGDAKAILTLNGGSSSIRFALFAPQTNSPPQRLAGGKIERIGLDGTSMRVQFPDDHREQLAVEARGPEAVAAWLVEWLAAQPVFANVAAVGHRVVHGMARRSPEPVTPDLLDDLRRIAVLAPDHLPAQIKLIEAFEKHSANARSVPQIACFDSAFHADMPAVARRLPIPKRFDAQGVQRYGFHGLSYSFVVEELARVAAQRVANGRLVLAHLGGGASMAAVHAGRSLDTTMGFTPAAGLPMGTRSGDLDPAIGWYLQAHAGMSAEDYWAVVNHESGLRALSETSSDMQDLLARESHDDRAREAVALFCYQCRKQIGAYAAALGGLDALVFTGGIGEHSAAVRERICGELAFLGIAIDPDRNATHADVISKDDALVEVRVVRTDEERMIAESVCRVLDS